MVRGIAPADATKGALPLWIPCQGPCPWTPRRAFGPLDSRAGAQAQGSSFAGVTARDGRAATQGLRRRCGGGGIPRLRARAEGFAIIVASLSTSAFGGLATGEASPSALLRALLPVVATGSLPQYIASYTWGVKVSKGRPQARKPAPPPQRQAAACASRRARRAP